MSDQAKLKLQLKKTIRALLISAPLGLTPREVEKDYADFEGHPLPYRRLGYNTCEDFLQGIPDTVRPQWERGHLVVHAVADKSTKHIHSLVSRQKVDVQKCLKKRQAITRRGARPFGAGTDDFPARGPWRPGGLAGQTRSASPGIAFNSRPQRGPPSVMPSVPAYVRNQIKTFLIDHADGVRNVDFDKMFAEKFGHTICCNKLGFESLWNMCQALSDFVRVVKHSGGEFRIYEKSNYANATSHSENKLSDPSVELISDMERVNLNKANSSDGQISHNTRQDSSFKPSTGTANHSWQRPWHGQPHPSQPDGTSDLTAAPERRHSPEARPRRTPSSPASPTASTKDANAQATPNSPTSDMFETKFLREIQQVLAQHPNGVWSAYLSDEYKKQFNKALPMMSLGYFSVTELMAAMPEVVAIEREQKQGDWKLYDVRTYNPKPQEVVHPRSDSSAESTKANKVVDRTQGFLKLKAQIKQLLEGYPEGVLMKNLPLYYRRAFGKHIPLEELGINDLECLITMMPEYATVVYKGHGSLLVVPVEESRGLPRGKKTIPDDAVGWGFSYTNPGFPPLHQYIEVYVATVFTPHKISIQLKDRRKNEALDILMDNLESLYAYPEGNEYKFPESMVAVGQVCCALYLSDNNWHRGLITGIPNVDFVQVLYVDYGTIANVTVSSLRLLKSCFLRMPIQAFNAQLACIEPTQDKWTQESRDRLLSLTSGKPLIAYITDIKREVLHLLLSDTTTDEDIHVNDTLVEEGLARFASVLEAEGEQEIPPLAPCDQVSDEEVPDSVMDLWTLNDIVARETKPEEEEERDEGGDNRAASPEMRDAAVAGEVDVETVPPCLETGSNPSVDSQESNSADMPHLESPIGDDGQWIVKCIDLDDGNQLHLINHDNEACLTIAELADLLCGEEDSEPEEVLCQQVSALGGDIQLITVTENNNPRLFQELRRIEFLEDSENSPELLTMVPFSSALLLLGACPSVSMEVVQHLQEIAEELGIFGDLIEMDSFLDLEELQVTLEVLQFKRKRLLAVMMQNTDADVVDELAYVERTIHDVSERLELAKAVMQQQQKQVTVLDPTVDRAPIQSEAPCSPDPIQNAALNLDGNPRSPGRLVQAVEPIPRDGNDSTTSSQPDTPPPLQQQQQQKTQQQQQAGYSQPAAGQSQPCDKPATNQEPPFPPPAAPTHFPTFPNPQFLNPAPQYFLAQPGPQFTPLNAHYPLLGATALGYPQHLGSGDFHPHPPAFNPSNWLSAPPPSPFVPQFAGPPQVPLNPLPPLGNPPPHLIMNPQGYRQGDQRMPSQPQGGQGSWW